MRGDHSQKLLPWRGIPLLSRAQETSGSKQNQYSSPNEANRNLNEALRCLK
jgi:hypothetical protein